MRWGVEGSGTYTSMVGDGPYYVYDLQTLTYSLREMVPLLSPSRADKSP